MPNLSFPEVRTRTRILLDRLRPYGKAALGAATKRNTVLTVLECACAFSVLFGISWYSVPAALIIGGLGGIFAVERQQRG